jgi:putative heme iron utilization protein
MARRRQRAAQGDNTIARLAPRSSHGAQLLHRPREQAYGVVRRQRRDLRDVVATAQTPVRLEFDRPFDGAGGGDCVRCRACVHY